MKNASAKYSQMNFKPFLFLCPHLICNVILILIFVLLCHNTNGQIKFLLNDSNIEYRTLLPNAPDSIVFIKSHIENEWKYNYCGSYEVYFDEQFEQLAYKSVETPDSCITFDYWRNGKIKKITVYKKNLEGLEGIAAWWYEETYCENGQLMYKGPSNLQPGKKLCTNYYCNGNKRLEFYLLGIGPDGKMTRWFENGKIQSEFYYKENEPIGEWKYWNEDGMLFKIEIYSNGE